MKILFCSYQFAPSIGGIETVSRILAEEFVAAGHEVHLLTTTPGSESAAYSISRSPRHRELLGLFRWADLVFHNNISLRFAWPLLVLQKPWVIAHHTWICQSGTANGYTARLKLRVLRRARNIAISSAIASHLQVQSAIIPDPYDPRVFHVRRDIERTRDLVFVGRLVSDKGVDLLLRAIELLVGQGLPLKVSIVGDGPKRAALRRQASEAGISEMVAFTGFQSGNALAELLNQHRLLAIPSRWNEPFGVVALEGIACGCAVVGTSGGGLPEAIGPCGLTVKNGDAAELAQAIKAVLSDPGQIAAFRSKAEAHLKKHQPGAIAEKYLEQFELAAHGNRG